MSVKTNRMARHHRRNKEKSFSLNMVSLMDIFTILVFFLLVTSSESQVVSQPKNIVLPESVATKTPKQNTVILVSENKVEIFGESIKINPKRMNEKAITNFIREKLMRSLYEELPYWLTVSIEQFNEQKKIIKISAVIWTERASQKAIIIGKNGALLKKIGTEARKDMETRFGKKVYLELWVKVKAGWSEEEGIL